MSKARIWRLAEHRDAGYASCWLRSPPVCLDEVCPACRTGTKYMSPTPLALEWEAGSDTIGDFSWPSGDRVAVQQRVIELLSGRYDTIHAGDVAMIQDPKLKRSKNRTRGKPRVWLPYEGPRLVELVVTHLANIAPETTMVVDDPCPTCRRASRRLIGFELKEHRWSQEVMDLVPYSKSRVPGQGVFVPRSEVGGAGIFRAKEVVPGILCTDEVKALLEEAKFTNLDFLEYGDIV